MKNKFTLIKSVLFATVFSFVLTGQSIGQDAHILKTDAVITADGLDLEPAWEDVAAVPIDSVSLDAPTITAATWKALWDEDNIYVFISVEEDAHFSDPETRPWKNDSPEIFFDIGNTDGEEYDAGDWQIRYTIHDMSLDKAEDLPGAQFMHVLNGTNYTFEIAISWSELKGEMDWNPAEDAQIGFNVQINDNDGEGRTGAVAWSTSENIAHKNPSALGTVELALPEAQGPVSVDAEIGKTDAVITADGLDLEPAWEDVAAVPIDSVSLDAPTITAATWKALWDEDNIYVFISVEEDAHFSDPETRPWKNDSPEIFFDIGNTDGEEYDAGDWQIRYTIHDMSLDKAEDLPGAQFMHVLNGTNYTFEIAISWSELKGEMDWNPAEDAQIGFNVQINDNDGDGRVGAIAWSTSENIAHKNPSALGTVSLKSEVTVGIKNIASQNTVEIFPNPVSNELNINNALQGQNVSIYSITGQIVKNAYLDNHLLDVSDLKKGIYIIQVRNKSNYMNSIKFIKR